ncbi:amidohydrolase family protein [Variovorax sp. E3]|uniref:amidohydrolase family protein n=1 Tax=Variovorax sp. E3 TaxID=1914993 RepID=UPI0035B133A6
MGTEDEARAAVPSATRTVDLRGRMVMPGIIDVHNHFLWAGQAELYETNFAPTLSLAQVLERVREAAAKEPADGWIVGGIWGSGLFGELTREARTLLDEAAGGRPVMLRDDSHHNRWVSTAALRLAGIDAGTPDPLNGEIVRDPATGERPGCSWSPLRRSRKSPWARRWRCRRNATSMPARTRSGGSTPAASPARRRP